MWPLISLPLLIIWEFIDFFSVLSCPVVNQLVALEYTWDSASRSEDVLNASCVSQMDASRVLEIFLKMNGVNE